MNTDGAVLVLEESSSSAWRIVPKLDSLGIEYACLCPRSKVSEVVANYRLPIVLISAEMAPTFFDGYSPLHSHTEESVQQLVVAFQRTDSPISDAGLYKFGVDVVLPDDIDNHRLEQMISRWLIRRHAYSNATDDSAARSLALVQAAYDRTIEGWIHVLDMRDDETEGHSVRVAQMTVQVARAFGIQGEELNHIWRGALLHDVGKLAIPDDILKKKGKLSPDERLVMEEHPVRAYEMLKGIEYLQPALNIPLYHHERWDGTGYPFQVAGAGIPLHARIFAIVDVFDALSFDRPYRKAMPRQEVIEHLRNASGKHFDPEVVRVFLKILDRITPGCWTDSASKIA
ncbi:HD-GYP domain-containing protein [Kamptonema cortianum]|nr:HD-GYP domain-containing protein [Kamptonema cortianum]